MNSLSNICIVDDDDIYQFMVTKTLESLGLAKKIIAFSDGEEALNFMVENLNNENELPDIILLDINMPIMDGFQFMEEYVKLIPKVSKSIVIYIVSSSVDPVDIERAKNISAISGYIIKPTKPGELKSLIEKLKESGRLYL
ncbi:response regulator [Algoriphagus aquimarinus]|uniref:Response regulator receiver domain-containing protein n=1 Tax=Algoriphagus aquimarinus TaxID=237018 RepID=A0A1I0VJ05_9BACT|nr:response regulator [Algoriphagus aquimarinus]SFA76479.1 Response regulator receiver domain-containing protein [Algoriphagus aquimarinus]|tara:strand:+ start:337666 stop:338088 length:423 start_codon:yes stop_codon:yes gene_type:complete